MMISAKPWRKSWTNINVVNISKHDIIFYLKLDELSNKKENEKEKQFKDKNKVKSLSPPKFIDTLVTNPTKNDKKSPKKTTSKPLFN